MSNLDQIVEVLRMGLPYPSEVPYPIIKIPVLNGTGRPPTTLHESINHRAGLEASTNFVFKKEYANGIAIGWVYAGFENG